MKRTVTLTTHSLALGVLLLPAFAGNEVPQDKPAGSGMFTSFLKDRTRLLKCLFGSTVYSEDLG